MSPLWDAATGGSVPYARLVYPVSYVVAAPLFGLWDALALLTLHQHYAVLATLVVLYLLIRLRAARSRIPIPGKSGMELVRALLALLLLLLFYAAALFIPRPMVALRLTDPELVAVDFHSHTNESHDGWELFGAAKNRRWHEGGGFHAAYVTDHYTWAGVDAALPDNPDRAGWGTVLLSGAEIRLRDRHTNVLGDRTRYMFALDSTLHRLSPDSIEDAFYRGSPAPTMLHTIPGPLDGLVSFGPRAPAGVIGIELNDGAPRGLEQGKGRRESILAMADSMDLAVVAGSNLHGWGSTVAAWSVMRIPGWPSMSPFEIGDAIEATLHRDRRGAATVVERRMPHHGASRLALVLTGPRMLWEYLRMLTPPERLSWLAWTTALVLVSLTRRAFPRPGRG